MTTANTMLERALSIRRSPHATDDASCLDDGAGDESKTRKHISIAMRASNFLTRTGYIWPVLIIVLLIVIILSVIINSRDLVCISASTSDHLSRSQNLAIMGLLLTKLSKHGKNVEWTSKDLLNGLEEFIPMYETRPIKKNMYGMGFDHSFGLWFVTRWLKPDLMIESGAFKGHSTWVLSQAMPDIPILSISPRHPQKYLKKGPAYVDGNCTYFAGKEFVDFGSMDWGKLMRKYGIKDRTQVLIFFDDHQNELKRLKQALKAGVKHLIFYDNYDTGTGDHYSLRQICDQFYIRGGGHSCFKESDEARIRFRRRKFWEKAVDTEELCGPGETWWGVRGQMLDDFNHSNRAITYGEHFKNSRFVESVLDVYWELPPVAGPSLTHQTRYDPARTTTPIVEDGRHSLFRKLGLSQLDPSVFNGYTQMVYVQVSKPES
ncbi:hypothetical protein SASPL_139529 [Salvia splendens]|uniref:Uncharacterized protein n=1 Tax=Salvia splendens TaxID=180675 RepID=A0A8X8WN39_SALSN|nr:hypothetical protein SASPL_139529 [Salvia splendens]